MTPAVPPLPTSWNLSFQVSVGSHTSKRTAGLVTPTRRQTAAAIVPTGAGFAPAGRSWASSMVVSLRRSFVRSAQATGFGFGLPPCAAACGGKTATAARTAIQGRIFLVIVIIVVVSLVPAAELGYAVRLAASIPRRVGDVEHHRLQRVGRVGEPAELRPLARREAGP